MNANPNRAASETQKQRILHALQAGQSLTPLVALNEFGCLRLGARIWDLRKRGHAIRRELIDPGNGKKVASYSLAPEGAVESVQPETDLVNTISTGVTSMLGFTPNGKRLETPTDVTSTPTVRRRAYPAPGQRFPPSARV